MAFLSFLSFIISFDLLRHFNIYSHQILQNYCSFCFIIDKWKFQIIMHSLGVVDCVAILFQLMRQEKMAIKEFCEYYKSLTIYHIDDIVVSWRYVSLLGLWWFFILMVDLGLWVFQVFGGFLDWWQFYLIEICESSSSWWVLELATYICHGDLWAFHHWRC